MLLQSATMILMCHEAWYGVCLLSEINTAWRLQTNNRHCDVVLGTDNINTKVRYQQFNHIETRSLSHFLQLTIICTALFPVCSLLWCKTRTSFLHLYGSRPSLTTVDLRYIFSCLHLDLWSLYGEKLDHRRGCYIIIIFLAPENIRYRKASPFYAAIS